jgi:hypothetical protein
MKSSRASPVTESLLDDSADDATAEALSEGQLYDFITNQPVEDSPAERTLQTVARSLVDEYGFDHTQLSRDYSIAYDLTDNDGRTRKARQRISVAVFPEGTRKSDADKLIRACLIQPRSCECGTKLLGFILPLVERIPVPLARQEAQDQIGDMIFEAYDCRAEALHLEDRAQVKLAASLEMTSAR